MATSLLYRSSGFFRNAMNLYPPYWGTGISVVNVSPDWKRLVVEMQHRFYNMNAFGTHFGGSLYAMCDPHYVLLLLPLLGPNYVVWDKAAVIEFLKPGRGTVRAEFTWEDSELDEIRLRTVDGQKFEPTRTVEVRDA